MTEADCSADVAGAGDGIRDITRTLKIMSADVVRRTGIPIVPALDRRVACRLLLMT